MKDVYVIVLIIIIIYIVSTFNPYLLPEAIYQNHYMKKFNEYNNKFIEKFTNLNMGEMQLKSFYKNLATKNENVIGFHYTDWCPHCQQMKPIWISVKNKLIDQNGYKFIEIDEDKSHTPGIEGYPTIIKFQNGQIIKYQGDKDAHTLLNFII